MFMKNASYYQMRGIFFFHEAQLAENTEMKDFNQITEEENV